MKKLNENFEEILGSQLNENGITGVSKFTKDVRDFYFNKNPITVKEREILMQFRGDVMFFNDIRYVVERQLQKRTPTFMYRFSYKTDHSLLRRSPINENIQGKAEKIRNISIFFSGQNNLKSLKIRQQT